VGRLSGLEILEGRVLLDAVRWINPAGGVWEVASNWDASRTPGPDDDAIIDLQGVAVNHTSGTESVHSLQLTGSTLTLSDGTLAVATKVQGDGTLILSGGTLAGATVAAGLTFQDGSRGTLDHVTVNTDLVFIGRTTVGVSVVNGLVLNGTIFLGGSAGTTTGSIVFQNTETVHGRGRIDLGTGHSAFISIANGATVTLGQHVTITGRAGMINDLGFGGWLINKGTTSPVQGFSIDNCINQGTIVAQAGTIDITNCTNTGTIIAHGGNVYLGSFVNTGTVMAAGGILTLGGWTNDGVISTINDVAVTLGTGTNVGGTVSASDRVTMRVNGTVTDTNSSLTLLGSSVLTLGSSSATLFGGTVAGSGTVQFYLGTLDGVTLDADMTLYGNGAVYIQNGLTLNGTLHLRSVVDFLGTQQIDGSGSIIFDGDRFSYGAAEVDGNNSVLTLGPDLTVHGPVGAIGPAGSSNARLVDEGTIAVDSGGAGLRLTSFTNAGGTVMVGANAHLFGDYTQTSGVIILDNGEIDANPVDLQGGTLMGSGLIVGNVRNAALLVVGGPGTPGRLTIRGNYTQTAAGTLRLEVGGSHPGVEFDQLVVTGQAALDGTLAVALINGFVPASGDTFPIITAGSVQGVFATLDLDPAFQDPHYNSTGVTLIAS
jgi:hypothetical protein